MKSSEQLISRLRKQHPELNVPADVQFRRIGRNVSSGLGRWSWHLLSASGNDLYIGSHWPVHALLVCNEPWQVSRLADQDRTLDPAAADTSLALASMERRGR